MNGISFLIYVIGMVGNFSVLFAWLGALLIAGFLIGSFILLGVTSDTYNKESFEEAWKWVIGNAWKFIAGGVFFIMLSIATPSKQTMVLIAASEIAEEVVAIEEVAQVGGEAGMLIRESISLLRGHIAEEIQSLDLKTVGTDAAAKVVEAVKE